MGSKSSYWRGRLLIAANRVLHFLSVPASFAVPVENSTVVVGNSATVECAVEGDNPITGTRDQM